MWISREDYFGPWLDCPDATDGCEKSASALLTAVDALLDDAFDAGCHLPINPVTRSRVSGDKYGGFRPQACKQGVVLSSHKIGAGIDIYDPYNELDNWITEDILETHGLYREWPKATNTWCHLTTRRPPSGRRTFIP